MTNPQNDSKDRTLSSQEKHNLDRVRDKYIQKSSDNLSADSQLSEEIKDKLQAINTLMLQIFLDPKDKETHNVIPYIRYLINSFKLGKYFDEYDVLIETYTVAVSSIKNKNLIIQNRVAWFKRTAFFIINNLHRERKRLAVIQKDLEEEQKSTVSDVEISDRVHKVITALGKIDVQDRQLLILRVVKGLSWSDIAEQLIKEGKESEINKQLLDRLRKRGQRALACLRSQYEIDCGEDHDENDS